MDADPWHAERLCLLQHRVGHLLVIHPPAVVKPLRRGARVAFPGIHLQRAGLQVHEVKIGLAQLRRGQPVRQHPLRASDAVDLVPDVGHLLRRHHRLLRVRAWGCADETERGLAVQEHFFDEIFPGEVGQGSAIAGELGIHAGFSRAATESEESLLGDGSFVQPFGIRWIEAGADIVRLDIEDEERPAFAFVERRCFHQLHPQHVEETAEDGIHRQKRRGHAARGLQEVPAAHAQATTNQLTGLVN